MVALPAATPLTRPLALTVATAGAELVQVKVRPLSVLPAASFAVAASCTVAPAATLAVLGVMATDAVATVVLVTVARAEALLPLPEAVIWATPAFMPRTRPLELTVAIDVSELVHAIVTPVTGCALRLSAVAFSCDVAPTVTLNESGATSIWVTVVRQRESRVASEPMPPGASVGRSPAQA
jgi:hypothetical protein